MEFIKTYPDLRHLSLSGTVKGAANIEYAKNEIFDAINALASLTSLKFHLFTDETLNALADAHGDLEELDLSRSSITGRSVAALAKLKNLHTLNVADTALSMYDIVQLADQLPNLKFLTIQLPKAWTVKHDHRRIADELALQGIEVSFSDQ